MLCCVSVSIRHTFARSMAELRRDIFRDAPSSVCFLRLTLSAWARMKVCMSSGCGYHSHPTTACCAPWLCQIDWHLDADVVDVVRLIKHDDALLLKLSRHHLRDLQRSGSIQPQQRPEDWMQSPGQQTNLIYHMIYQRQGDKFMGAGLLPRSPDLGLAQPSFEESRELGKAKPG
jgi:hypothetical protein